MSVYTHVLRGVENQAVKNESPPQSNAACGQATGTDDSVHVQNPGISRERVAADGATRLDIPLVGTSQGGNANSLECVVLGNEKAPMTSPVIGASLMGDTGLEPVTSCVSSRRSSQLS